MKRFTCVRNHVCVLAAQQHHRHECHRQHHRHECHRQYHRRRGFTGLFTIRSAFAAPRAVSIPMMYRPTWAGHLAIGETVNVLTLSIHHY